MMRINICPFIDDDDAFSNISAYLLHSVNHNCNHRLLSSEAGVGDDVRVG